jgi:hypothetical protein
MIEVEILGIVVTHQYGTLNTGDVLRTDPEFARHLVEDCGAAKYRDAPQPAEASQDVPADAGETPSLAKTPRAKK